MSTVTIRNVASTGRYAEGVGEVAPNATVEVSPEVAASVCDGDNFARVDAPAASVDAQTDTPPAPRRAPKQT